MTFATWLIPLALSALVFGLVGLASLDGQSEPPTRSRSLDPQGSELPARAYWHWAASPPCGSGWVITSLARSSLGERRSTGLPRARWGPLLS